MRHWSILGLQAIAARNEPLSVTWLLSTILVLTLVMCGTSVAAWLGTAKLAAAASGTSSRSQYS